MKKINYNELQELLKSGKTQTECARYFGVSVPAVCKAVKRLKALELPPSLEKLTEKEKRYVLNRATGKSKAESALLSFDCDNYDSAKSLGYRLSKDPDVQVALSDLMAQEEIPRRRRIQRLKDLIESKDPSVVSKGLDLSWRLDGSYAPQKRLNLNVSYPGIVEKLAEIDKEETDLRRQLAELGYVEGEIGRASCRERV